MFFPLLFIYTYELNSNLNLIGKIGPQLGLLMKAELIDKDGNSIIKDHKPAYQDFDIGGVVNAGLGIKLNDKLSLDVLLRYDYGFTDAENKDYPNNINNPITGSAINGNSMANRAITNNMTAGLTVGVKYLFGEINK